MDKEQQFAKILAILDRAELLPRTTEHLRVFLFSLMDDERFEPMLHVLESNPDVFDEFATAFRLKRRLLEHGGAQSDWDYLLYKEKELIQLIK